MVPAISTSPCTSRTGGISSVNSARNRWPGRRTMRAPWIGQLKCWASRASSGLAIVRWPKNVTGRIVRLAVKHRAVEFIGRGADRGQFPVAEVRGEDQGRLAVVLQLLEALDRGRLERNAAVLGMEIGILVP